MRIFAAILGMIIFLFAASAPASGQSATLAGEWATTNPNTRGITSVVISGDGTNWNVDAWGRCHPQDCRWGVQKLTPLGENVEDNSFERGFAIWNPGFADKFAVFALEGKLLRVEIVTIFKDRSRRSSFRAVEYLRRVVEQ